MADVRALGPLGMVTLRTDLAAAAGALRDGLGLDVPERLRIAGDTRRGAAWMAPDELLLFVAPGEGGAVAADLGRRLGEVPHLCADVSDLRVGFAVEGEGWREVLAKLSPADLHPDAFGSRAFRRTRLGQVAAAIWPEGDGAHVLVFRSFGDYTLRLLRQSAFDGAVGFF
ncbi:sarcosine oxidase subunit gamma [Rubellimicrobium sp. CFH 75288]|uniref:sarcosine oxidase subunit gamma n=1 Tax=Rubellimicrobium sp. CFH 75288 TaxID=2697034 RepID=UPI001FB678C1|nr:sarcosine oxidase subunit gamma family protein [Rubellimicrobium sp. CFH 75288]